MTWCSLSIVGVYQVINIVKSSHRRDAHQEKKAEQQAESCGTHGKNLNRKQNILDQTFIQDVKIQVDQLAT